MKKGKTPVVEEVAPQAPEEPVEPEVPTFGYGKFEYRDQSTYCGNWKMLSGHKVKHGHGRAVYAGLNGQGCEEYCGDWKDDLMHGYGKYVFTSGSVYTGQWECGKMHGKGRMVNADGTRYDGDWHQNKMHGEGCYIDIDSVKWEGIFINGSYESKIQKKLRVEKEISDKVANFETKAKQFFTQFINGYNASNEDKAKLKANLSGFFASPDTCIDYVAEPYCKYEEHSPEKWCEIIRSCCTEDDKCNI